MTAKELINLCFGSDNECDFCFLGGLDVCELPCSRCIRFEKACNEFIMGINPLI